MAGNNRDPDSGRDKCERPVHVVRLSDHMESRTARAKLAPSEKPYWRFVDSGLHIGYRNNLHGGKWVVRRYLGNQTYATETLASSDDRQDADGKTILSFSQAQKKSPRSGEAIPRGWAECVEDDGCGRG
jgi:hypothetical protein